MSASQMARQACSHAQNIPSKRVIVTDASQLPEVYSSTPGGTLYSTTPGGTKIIYERAFLMNLKNSPLSRTPPKNFIPSGLVRNNAPQPIITTKPIIANGLSRSPPLSASSNDQEEQFDMDI